MTTCVLCFNSTKLTQFICANCQNKLPKLTNYCLTCGQQNFQITEHCGYCLTNSINYDKFFAAFPYTYPINWLLSNFKFNRQISIGRTLAKILIHYLPDQWWDDPAELIIPVPIHRNRMWWRGFNQTNEIAKLVSGHLNIDYNPNAVIKIIATQPQTNLTGKLRRTNLVGVFKINSTKKLNGKHVALLDDVVTTGTTINQLSKLLKQAGVSKITILSLARGFLRNNQ